MASMNTTTLLILAVAAFAVRVSEPNLMPPQAQRAVEDREIDFVVPSTLELQELREKADAILRVQITNRRSRAIPNPEDERRGVDVFTTYEAQVVEEFKKHPLTVPARKAIEFSQRGGEITTATKIIRAKGADLLHSGD